MAKDSDAGKKFRCKLCDRTFRMAPHLGRHMATTHGRKSKRKARTAAPPRRGVAPRPSARTAAGLNAPAASIRKFREELLAQRQQLDRQIASLDRALAALGGR